MADSCNEDNGDEWLPPTVTAASKYICKVLLFLLLAPWVLFSICMLSHHQVVVKAVSQSNGNGSFQHPHGFKTFVWVLTNAKLAVTTWLVSVRTWHVTYQLLSIPFSFCTLSFWSYTLYTRGLILTMYTSYDKFTWKCLSGSRWYC